MEDRQKDMSFILILSRQKNRQKLMKKMGFILILNRQGNRQKGEEKNGLYTYP